MTEYSIMGYSVKNSKDDPSLGGFIYDICYNGEEIARAKFLQGNSGIGITLLINNLPPVVEDFTSLVSKATDRGCKTHLLTEYCTSVKGALTGFLHLLKDLNSFIGSVSKTCKYCKERKYKYYGVALLGSCWINYTCRAKRLFVNLPLNEVDSNVALTRLDGIVKNQMKSSGLGLSALAFISGDFDWNLTESDFLNLFDVSSLD